MHSNLTQLTQALRLPESTLATDTLSPEGINLLLLKLKNSELSLLPEQIAHFWQQLPYWAFAWAGGRALAQWLAQHPSAVKGKRVLDFGCGSGLVGIACALAGAKEVWVADLDVNALTAAQLNAQQNRVKVLPVQDEHWPDIDVLLASDVLYDISSSTDLRRWMMQVPTWYLAESHYVKPTFVELQCLAQYRCSTLPKIGDFDEQVAIEIYTRFAPQ